MQLKSTKPILSIDGGATSTKYGIISKDGEILHTGIGKPLYLLEGTKEVAINLSNIIKGIPKIFDFDKVVVGVAGIDNKIDLKLADRVIQKVFRHYAKQAEIITTGDITLVIENGSGNKNAIALIAGTGTNCLGLNKTKVFKSGGLGHILSDQGSGYWVGLTALKASVMIADNRSQKSPLLDNVLKHYKISDYTQLKQIVYSNKFHKKDFGRLVRVVVKCANQGDKISIQILNESGKHIFLHAYAVFKKLSYDDKVELILAGSLFKVGIIKSVFESYVKKYMPDIQVLYPKQPSFYGGYLYLKRRNKI